MNARMNTLTRTAALCATLALVAPAPRAQDEPGETRAAAEALETLPYETLTRKLRDGVVMTADYYSVEAADEAAGVEEVRRAWGVVVALHKDRSSRGEYRIAGPELNKLGLDVLAVDLRAGKKSYTVENGTAKSFAELVGGVAKPKDAYDDVDQAVRWARSLQPRGPTILFGSASSAALALVYASREADVVDAVFCFSPGEYLRDWKVREEAGKLEIPVYATCGPGSKESSWASAVVSMIDKAYLTTFFPPRDVESLHGAMTLAVRDPQSRELQWRGVKEVLEALRTR